MKGKNIINSFNNSFNVGVCLCIKIWAQKNSMEGLILV